MRQDPLDDRLGEDEDAPAFDVQETVLFGVLRSRGFVVALALIGLVVGLLWGASQPNTYRSQAKLLLRIGEREQVTPESLVAGPRARETQPTIEDELHLLRDERIFHQVIADLGVDYILSPADPARYDSDETPLHVHLMHQLQALLIQQRATVEGAASGPDRIRAAIRILEQNTTMSAEFGSNVISVSHVSTSPEKSKRITDSLVEACIRRHREHFSIERRLDPMVDKLSQQENELELARRTRAEHIENCGLIDIATQGDLLLNELDAYRLQHAQAAIQRDENRERLDGLRSQLAATPRTEPVRVTMRQVENPQYTALLAEVQRLDERRHELSRVPMLKSQRDTEERRIDERRVKVLDELQGMSRTISDVGDVLEERENPLHLDLRREISLLEVEERGLATRINRLQDQIDRTMERIETLRVCTDLHESMDAIIRRRQSSFEEMEGAYNRLAALNAIDQRGETNLSVLQNGTLPLEKEGPRRARLLILGMILGGGFGVGIAVLRQLVDPRLRYPRGAARVLGLPSLGVVPELRAARQLPRSAGRQA